MLCLSPSKDCTASLHVVKQLNFTSCENLLGNTDRTGVSFCSYDLVANLEYFKDQSMIFLNCVYKWWWAVITSTVDLALYILWLPAFCYFMNILKFWRHCQIAFLSILHFCIWELGCARHHGRWWAVLSRLWPIMELTVWTTGETGVNRRVSLLDTCVGGQL